MEQVQALLKDGKVTAEDLIKIAKCSKCCSPSPSIRRAKTKDPSRGTKPGVLGSRPPTARRFV